MSDRESLWRTVAAACTLLTAAACQPVGEPTPPPAAPPEATSIKADAHSFSRPGEATVEHIDLDLTVDFAARRLDGRANLRLRQEAPAGELRLDTRDLDVHGVTLGPGGPQATFELGDEDPFLGRELIVEIGPDTRQVTVEYSTRPEAEALQWLSPAQTAGGDHPFLFSQSQAILARTWVPCQDTPAVRFTYNATLRVPPELMAVMSAENPTERRADGVYEFTMPQPIPSYLLAIAVGDLAFRPLGPRSGVYAEPGIVEAAAWEFAEVESMIDATEGLYGNYRWGRYDLLVLPPSFPFGGMENPRLTFATPTILAGDRSLVALVAHELAHSWSGNLVTNATWDDFWLNEGFTSYLENRIMEEVKGVEYATMLRALSEQDLRAEIDDLGVDSPDTHLQLDLAGRNPDDGMTAIAYDKGAAMLRLLEESLGRERWDAFLLDYFDRYAFQSIDTATFVAFLQARFGDDTALADADLESWIHGPGLPPNFPAPVSDAFGRVEERIASWQSGSPAGDLDTGDWSTHEWLHFLRRLPAQLTSSQMRDLDTAFGFSASGNAEVLCAWLQVAIRQEYEPAYPALEEFLTTVGRRKFLKPLYAELAKTPAGIDRGRDIYTKARPGYHAIATGTIDEILGWEAAPAS